MEMTSTDVIKVLDFMEKIEFTETCGACPESYDAKIGERIVGYLRLRWGYFSVRYPDSQGREVYSHQFPDHLLGMFPDEKTRRRQLDKAKAALAMELFDAKES